MNRTAVLAAVAALAYLPSLFGPFQFDDYNVIVNYPTVHSWQTLFERAGAGVRPLLKASYVLNWSIDPGPLGFHLVNVALHSLNVVLVFFLGKRLFPAHAGAAWVAALLFALHPMQTEAVTYVSGRSSSLMATFYLAAMLWYLIGGHWLITALLFVAACATRETAATLPAALLLCEIVRGTSWRAALRRQAALWLLLAAGGVFLLFNARYFDLIAYGYGTRSLADNLLTQVGGVSYLISRLLGLHGLNIDPGLPTLTEWSAALVFQATLLGLLLAFGFLSLRKRPWLAFGILWFFLQLAPTNSIIPRLDVANDRQVYLACWGLFLGLAIQLSLVPKWSVVPVAVAFAGFNIARQLDYLSEIALWESSVRESPWNARAHNNLGYAYYAAGRKAEAWHEIQTALFLDPAQDKAKANLLLLDWR